MSLIKFIGLLFFLFFFNYHCSGQERNFARALVNKIFKHKTQEYSEKIDLDELFLRGNLDFRQKSYFGFDAGLAAIAGDLPVPALREMGSVAVGHLSSPSFSFELKANVGQFSSRQPIVSWAPAGLSQESNFSSCDFSFKKYLSSNIKWTNDKWLTYIRRLYYGAGIGVIYSHTNIFEGYFPSRLNIDINNCIKKETVSPYFLVNFGFRMPIYNLSKSFHTFLLLNYQLHFSFTDYIDGYSPPKSEPSNHFYDDYTAVTAGLRFLFKNPGNTAVSSSYYSEERSSRRKRREKMEIEEMFLRYQLKFKDKLYCGLDGGLSIIHGDLLMPAAKAVGGFDLGYYVNPSSAIEIKAFEGQFSSSQPVDDWTPTGITSESMYFAFDILYKKNLFNIIKRGDNETLNNLRGTYFGTGIGFIYSRSTKFTGQFDLNSGLHINSFIQQSCATPYIPVNIGYCLPIYNFTNSIYTTLCFNYQLNFSFSGYLDNFSRDVFQTPHSFDKFSLFSVGLRFLLKANHDFQ